MTNVFQMKKAKLSFKYLKSNKNHAQPDREGGDGEEPE